MQAIGQLHTQTRVHRLLKDIDVPHTDNSVYDEYVAVSILLFIYLSLMYMCKNVQYFNLSVTKVYIRLTLLCNHT